MSELLALWAHVEPVVASPIPLITTLMMATIVILQYRGAPLAGYGVITYPGYKIFKQVFATIILLALLGRFSGSSGSGASPIFTLAFWGGLFVYSLVEYRFLKRRNGSETYLRVKTRKGLLDLYDRQACNLAISVAAAIVRHMRQDGVEYADHKAMQELYDAFEFPTMDEQDAAVREQMRERREKLANDRIFALEAEQIRREMDGAGE